MVGEENNHFRDPYSDRCVWLTKKTVIKYQKCQNLRISRQNIEVSLVEESQVGCRVKYDTSSTRSPYIHLPYFGFFLVDSKQNTVEGPLK